MTFVTQPKWGKYQLKVLCSIFLHEEKSKPLHKNKPNLGCGFGALMHCWSRLEKTGAFLFATSLTVYTAVHHEEQKQTWLSPHPTLVTSSVLSWVSVFTAIKISMVVKNKCICKEFHMGLQVKKMLLKGPDFVFLIETLSQRAQRIPAAKNAGKVVHRLSY